MPSLYYTDILSIDDTIHDRNIYTDDNILDFFCGRAAKKEERNEYRSEYHEQTGGTYQAGVMPGSLRGNAGRGLHSKSGPVGDRCS